MRRARSVISLLLILCASQVDAQTDQSAASLLTKSGAASDQIVRTFLLITAMSFLPAILLSMTCFTRFVIAFSFLRSGLGLQSTPTTLILIILSLFMTWFVMAPVIDKAWSNGGRPYLEGRISDADALKKITEPFISYMQAHVRDQDYRLFHQISRTKDKDQGDENTDEITVLVPAFIISELRRGFELGLLIILPFLIIDLIVATLIMSMGMMMMPPTVVALPIKILFFILIDGWNLLVGSLLRSAI